LTLHIDMCKLIRQVAPPVVGIAAKLKLFWLVTLLPWPLTFRPVNGVGLPTKIFSLPGLSIIDLGSTATGQTDTDGQKDDDHQRLIPQPNGAGIIKALTAALMRRLQLRFDCD